MAVHLVERWILARPRHGRFLTLAEHNVGSMPARRALPEQCLPSLSHPCSGQPFTRTVMSRKPVAPKPARRESPEIALARRDIHVTLSRCSGAGRHGRSRKAQRAWQRSRPEPAQD